MKKWAIRLGWMALGIVVLYAFAAMAGVVSGGSVDPPGPVGSTMKSFADVPPSWRQILDSSNGDVDECNSTRFTCVFGGQGVLDNETGLVWEQTPIWSGTDTWTNAQTLCTSDPKGGRYGWRLPSAAELLTLKDSNTLALASPNPFSGVVDNGFWTATEGPDDPSGARFILFTEFGSNEQVVPKTLGNIAGIWCVRGGAEVSFDTPDGLTSWSKKLTAIGLESCHTQRFTCVLDGAARARSRDRARLAEGLAIQRQLELGPGPGLVHEAGAGQPPGLACRDGSRDGLADRSDHREPDASLPFGHPFQNTNDGAYWTSTEKPGAFGQAYVVTFLGLAREFQGSLQTSQKREVRFVQSACAAPSDLGPCLNGRPHAVNLLRVKAQFPVACRRQDVRCNGAAEA